MISRRTFNKGLLALAAIPVLGVSAVKGSPLDGTNLHVYIVKRSVLLFEDRVGQKFFHLAQRETNTVKEQHKTAQIAGKKLVTYFDGQYYLERGKGRSPYVTLTTHYFSHVIISKDPDNHNQYFIWKNRFTDYVGPVSTEYWSSLDEEQIGFNLPAVIQHINTLT